MVLHPGLVAAAARHLAKTAPMIQEMCSLICEYVSQLEMESVIKRCLLLATRVV